MEREKCSNNSADVTAKETNVLIEEIRKKVDDFIVKNKEFQQETVVVGAIQPPPNLPKDAVEDSDLVAALRADITRLQNKNEELICKSKAIERRYRDGCLVRFLFPPWCSC